MNDNLDSQTTNDHRLTKWHSNPSKPKSPERKDEISISGSMPAPQSDDNVLDAAHKEGDFENADEEHPVPVDERPDVEQIGHPPKENTQD